MKTIKFQVQTEANAFPSGTVGGKWAWYLDSGKGETLKWMTDTVDAQRELEDGGYKISAQRVDINESVLGPMVSSTFEVISEAPPEDVIVDVAAAIMVIGA